MIPITSIPTTTLPQIALAKRESDPEQFRASLDLQSVAMLQTMLDPALTASIPGAGSALTQADLAEQGVAAVASKELAKEESRLGARGRGQDVSSQARQELAAKGEQPEQLSTTSGSVTQDTNKSERAEAQSHHSSGQNREGSGQTREFPTRDSNSQQNDKLHDGAKTFARHESGESGVSAASGRRGESAFSAISTTAPQAAVTASPSASGGVGQVPSVGKVTPPVGSGQVADQRASQTNAKKQVLRHEPRTFEAQLQRGLAQVLRQKGGTLSLRLNPVNLGEVKISLSIAQGRVDGTIEATNETARGLLQQNIDKLKSSLEQRGITVDRLEVRLAGASSSGTQIAQGQDAQANQNQQHADAGSDRQQGSAQGEDRHRETRGRIPDESVPAGLRGAESEADDDAAHGSAAEPLGGWLRLDTLA